MISIFHGNNEQTHDNFQNWRKKNVNGFHMTENAPGQFTIHYTMDKRENIDGKGCMHQGVSDNKYLENGCYTTARKVCSNNLLELFAWAKINSFITKTCKHCNTKQFPFPSVGDIEELLPEELYENSGLQEGALRQIVVNIYERNIEARKRCIEYYGAICCICNFDFGKKYGEIANGFIHVHHIKPISEIGSEYYVDPVTDLRPVCPNCHAVIHIGGMSRSIEEMKKILK